MRRSSLKTAEKSRLTLYTGSSRRKSICGSFSSSEPGAGQGIGRKAMDLLRSKIWPKGTRLTVEVLVKNDAGVAFWRAVGCTDYSLTLEILPEDIFDVVNERDEVIDAKPRSEVHARGLLHRAAHVFVFNSRGEIFLQKRSMNKDRQPGVWDSSCSGHVDSGETYDQAAVRELHEELGLKNKSQLEKLFKIDACAATDAEFVWVYRCQDEGPFRLQPEEIETGDWFTPEKVSRWTTEKPGDFATAFVLIWKKYWAAQSDI